MNLDQALRLSESKDDYISSVYDIVARKASFNTIAGDSSPVINLSGGDIDEIIDLGYDKVKSNYIANVGPFVSPQEAHDTLLLQIAGDTVANPVNRVGTLMDPTVYTHSDIPIMMGPHEGSSVYAPGGLPASIIDKKAISMVSNGASFKQYDDFWDNDKVKELEDAAYTSGFNDAIQEASRDAFIYGGSVIYPVFNNDTPSTYLKDMEKMSLEKGCINRWVVTDRWNVVTVPSYIVTSSDYLHPRSLFIPQSSLDVSTSRISLLRPKPIPYWIALYNIGWAPSDFTGWLRNYYGYEIVVQGIPVMAQQMSLLLYKMPLDGLNATIGPDKVRQLMEINEEKMAEWSSLSPKAVNMVGDVEIVDRSYGGLDQLIGVMKSDLASQCGIPEPALWHTPNKGFSDNTTESLLKQSETLMMYQKFIERYMKPMTNALIAHVYGTGSEEWNKRDTILMTFNKPQVNTEKDMADIGAKFAASVSSFCQAGVSPDIALQLSAQFFPSVKVTDEMINMAKKSYDEVMAQAQTQAGAGPGMPGTKAQPKVSPAKTVGNTTGKSKSPMGGGKNGK